MSHVFTSSLKELPSSLRLCSERSSASAMPCVHMYLNGHTWNQRSMLVLGQDAYPDWHSLNNLHIVAGGVFSGKQGEGRAGTWLDAGPFIG